MCQDRQGFMMSWKAGICIWIGNPFNSQTEHEDFCHIYTEKRGIHSLFVKWRSNFHAVLGNRFILLSLTSTRSKMDIWEDVNIPETTVSPLHFVCLKMIMIIKSSCLHEKQNKKISPLNKEYSDTSNLNNLNYLFSHFPSHLGLKLWMTFTFRRLNTNTAWW